MNQASTEHQNLQGRPRMVHAVKTMPRWKWMLLTIGLVVGCVGVVVEVTTHLANGATPAAQTSPGSTGAAPGGSSGFMGSSPQASSSADNSTGTSSPTLIQAMAPFMSHFGFSIFTGIVVGLIFRTFLRMALMLSALVIAAAAALSYFGHINVDLSAVKTDTSQAVSWLTDQGYRVKDMIFHALPSSTAASIGFLLGFKKR